MDKGQTGKRSWWQAHRPTTRRLVQLYSALLHNAYIKGFIDGKIYEGNAKSFCVPGLNCYSCPGAAGACPLGSLQGALSAAGHKAGWYVLGILMLFGVIMGRTICGWLCPLGLIQELLHKVPTLKIRKSLFTRALSWMKYGFLAIFVVAIPLYCGLTKDLPFPAFCKYICPAGTLEGAVGHLANPGNASMYSMLGVLFTRKWVIMLVIGLACIFCYRSFCRFVCPLGAIYGLFSRFNIIGVQVDAKRCNGCGVCVRHCGMDVKYVGDHECINCGKCMDVCRQGAISMKAGRIVLKTPVNGCKTEKNALSVRQKRLNRIFWGMALAVLCFALIWFNFLDPSIQKAPDLFTQTSSTSGTDAGAAAVESAAVSDEAEDLPEAEALKKVAAESWSSTAPVGYEVGDQLEDFALICYDGSEFHLADQRGRIVFINRWGTWCEPCKKELPYFNDLYRLHKGDIAMLVLHPSMQIEDPADYLAKQGYDMPCATDPDGDPVKRIVGGTSTLPQTVVLNRRGEVVYNSIKSVTPEILEALFTEADASAHK